MTAAAIGVALAAATMIFVRVIGLDRDRAFYPVVLIVVASFYILFAVIGKQGGDLFVAVAQWAFFAALAVVGFRSSLWVVAAGLVGHGLFDFVHHLLATGRGMPIWWPDFCASFDLAAGIGFGLILLLGRKPTTAGRDGSE